MPKGYAIHDTNKWTDFKVIDFDLKKEEDTVRILLIGAFKSLY